MNRRSMLQRSFGVLAVGFVLCVTATWSQTVRKPGPSSEKTDARKPDAGVPDAGKPRAGKAGARKSDDSSALTGAGEGGSLAEPGKRPGSTPRGSGPKAATDDPDFEVIRPWA